MVSDEKVMPISSKRIDEVKHTLHLNDESKYLVTGISTFKFRNKNKGPTNRCLHRHFHDQIQKHKHRTHKQMFTQAFPRSNSETKTPNSQTDVYTGISKFKFRNKNTGVTNRCLHRHFHVQIQKQKHRSHKQMFKAYNT